jgi:outer membrane protein, heavy metal efflux system
MLRSARLSLESLMRLVLLASLVMLCGGSMVRAQDTIPSREPPPLRLVDAIAWAREHHPSQASAAARVTAARQAPAMARSLMPPMVDATIWQWPVTTINPADVNMYMFMLEQELPGKGKRDLRATAAEREADRMVADATLRGRSVVTGVMQAYASLQAIELELAATRASERTASDLVRATEAAYAAGRGMQSTVLRATLAETDLTERLVMLAADREMRRITLNAAMGRAPDTAIGRLDDNTPFPVVPPLAVLLERAAETYPELGVARADIAAADAGIAVARAEGRPDWVVQGGYMLMPGEAGAWTARVGLTWPGAPWAKKRLTAATAEAEARAHAAHADLETTRQQVARMVGEARATLAGALSRLQILQDTMRPQAAQAVEASRIAFAAGQIPLAEAVDAQKMQLQTEAQIARLSGDAEIAWAALESIVGIDLRPAREK